MNRLDILNSALHAEKDQKAKIRLMAVRAVLELATRLKALQKCSASPHRSGAVADYLVKHHATVALLRFYVGSPHLNAVEET